MARFRFKLEPVLRLRRQAEQEQQKVVADIERQRRGVEDRLRQHQQNIGRGRADLTGALTGVIDTGFIRQTANVGRQVERLARQSAVELAGIYQRLEAARTDLAVAMQRRRAIELLKERRYAEFRARLNKQELQLLDELATQRASRPDDSDASSSLT